VEALPPQWRLCLHWATRSAETDTPDVA
jgi:hypothetical protein